MDVETFSHGIECEVGGAVVDQNGAGSEDSF